VTARLARRSPLESVRLPDGVREIPFLTQLDVRAEPPPIGARWPSAPNTVMVDDDVAVLWLAPDEWLIVGPPDATDAVESWTRNRLGDALRALVDVSANRTTLELRGPRARDLLESGCSIDLDRRAFGPGRCAQTLLARAQVVLWQLDEAPTYRLLVRPSLAAYVGAWLIDAAEGQDA
jgi:sarcosine oxidase subunit gamma